MAVPDFPLERCAVVDVHDVKEAVIVEGLGSGRTRVRERNVVSAVVVSSVARVPVSFRDLVRWVVVLRLHDHTIQFKRHVKSFKLRLLDEDLLLPLALTLFRNTKEVSDLVANQRKVVLRDGLPPSAEVVVSEQSNLAVIHVLCKHGVNEEDRRNKLLVEWVYRLVDVVSVFEEAPHLWNNPELGILGRCPSLQFSVSGGIQIAIFLRGWYSRVLTVWVGEIGELPLDVYFVSV